jgi:hypothetical protein
VRQIGRRNYSIGDDEVDGGPCGEEGIDGRKGVDEGKLPKRLADTKIEEWLKRRRVLQKLRGFCFFGTTREEECCFCLAVN